MSILFRVQIVLVVLFCAPAYGDDGLNVENTIRALESYFQKTRACIQISPSFTGLGNVTSDMMTENHKVLFDYLSEKGMYKKEAREESRLHLYKNDHKVKINTYTLTDFGSKFVGRYLSNEMPEEGLCYGKKKLISVSDFTAPTDFMGKRLSVVQYKYKIDLIEDWAKNENFYKFSEKLKKEINGIEVTSEETLMKYGSGWRVANEHVLEP